MPFDPTNPSKQIVLASVEPVMFPGTGHGDTIDTTGFRFLLFGVNVPGGALPIPPAGSTIEVDGLGPDTLWNWQMIPPFGIGAVGFTLLRAFQPITDHVRVAWTMVGAGGFGYWLIGQS